MTYYRTLYQGMCLALCFALLPQLALALPDDKDQPIYIEADEAVRDEKSGLTLYRGNVTIRQGTLRIDAQEVNIFDIETQADKIVATGSPARIEQQRTLEGAVMHAEGNTIEYFKEEERVFIRENAMLEQDGSIVQSDTIEYFINQELVKAATDQSVGDSKSRVEVVIPAHRVEAEQQDRPTPPPSAPSAE
ncbi:lipopolysaccharide transport periplasmic protein LptA [Halieaceae bacterium IMCC14734]|uniref:Lipopolysaccharide export system protein LptA n=1 Tax=Candidatus Litorirhabdus singularis TaxID=2518993 RepID=A0ABT3TJQ8_9GAMM|nr:lipopolysaccharide transport periplasmic protein LptA [Candidatus Litorirhabdus singularis]MCX2982455.1 lipopolysaccharide transport periplasmic protein LptA [Candidatus Litorirhabdus singularis]